MTQKHALVLDGLEAGYRDRTVVRGLDLAPVPGAITAIVGANACGKSTLLRTMSRLLPSSGGQVLLDGVDLHRYRARDLARTLGLLPQTPVAPDGISVHDLVGRGRHPYHGLLQRWSSEDDAAVAEALEATAVVDLAERDVDELSGGQRQRVWIAMALAQRTDILLLDEPTTFLDVSHQVEVLDLLVDLNHTRGTTIIMVLHDLNLAARYADQLVALRGGTIYATGTPEEVLTEATIEAVFGIAAVVMPDPVSSRPMMIPIGRHRDARGRPDDQQQESCVRLVTDLTPEGARS